MEEQFGTRALTALLDNNIIGTFWEKQVLLLFNNLISLLFMYSHI